MLPRTKRITVPLILGLAAVLAAGTAMAGPRGGRYGGPGKGSGMGPGPCGPAGVMLSRLDLTEAQTSRIEELRQEHAPKMEPLRDEMIRARRALRDATLVSPLDEAAVAAAAQELGRAQAAMAVERAKCQAEVRAVLTPEQIQQLDEARARFEERPGQRTRHPRRMLWKERGGDPGDAL
jgi:periplasmic protein CpxP/Spy